MTSSTAGSNTPWHARGPGQPHRAVRSTVLWGVTYAGFALVCVRSGTPLFLGPAASEPSWLGWAGVALGVLSTLSGAAVLRYGLRPALRGLLLALCALAGLAAFGLLMDVITLLFGQGVDGRASAANHVLAAAGALLLATAARPVDRPRDDDRAPAPSAASGAVHLAAWAGTLAFLPYAGMKLVWACGGTFAGVSGAQMREASRRNGASDLWLALESRGLDATVLLAAVGVFLLWGLVRPWGQVFPRWTPALRGRRVPRWLPLTPALLGAATLAPYGVLGTAYSALATAGVMTMRRGDFPSSDDALLVAWIGTAAFAVYGLALTVCARSYWVRTRRSPVPAGRIG
ncbi:hypothetical protein ACFV0R_02875 [Streptomyces sp. NPDC059578]|uniref:hypothetical protein n=1 Tax=Streptomyces sp. NPDC059578 TaxID=3346874 RepID=UPI003677025B